MAPNVGPYNGVVIFSSVLSKDGKTAGEDKTEFYQKEVLWAQGFLGDYLSLRPSMFFDFSDLKLS